MNGAALQTLMARAGKALGEITADKVAAANFALIRLFPRFY
jgi:hypothetical protein